jgi:ribosomal protein L3 glutamine methyltransferase
MTLAELIADSAQQLSQAGVHFGQGTLNATDEAAWLVLWQLGLPLDTALDEESGQLSAEDLAKARALIARRIETRQPAAYLTGEAWLQGVPFHVDARSIIPRSLIAEVLAEGYLDEWLPPGAPRIMDLCTGNGSLAVLAAMAWPEAVVQGLDLSAQALAVAERNVQRHHLQARIQLLASDGFAQASGRYDMILCNPPYVNAESMAGLPPEFQAEPSLALAGGADGMDFVRHCLRDAPQWLTPQGVLVLEIGHEIAYFEAAFPTLEGLWLPTSAGDEQVVLLTAQALQDIA